MDVNKETGFEAAKPINLDAINFVEMPDIETLNMKERDVAIGIYQGREVRGEALSKFTGEYEEQVVHLFKTPDLSKKFAVWNKGGLEYALKVKGVKVGDLVKLTRQADKVYEGRPVSHFEVSLGVPKK